MLVTIEQEASVSEASTIGLDIAKHVFQVHVADAAGHVRHLGTQMPSGASTLYHRRCLVSRSYMLARRVHPLGVTSVHLVPRAP